MKLIGYWLVTVKMLGTIFTMFTETFLNCVTEVGASNFKTMIFRLSLQKTIPTCYCWLDNRWFWLVVSRTGLVGSTGTWRCTELSYWMKRFCCCPMNVWWIINHCCSVCVGFCDVEWKEREKEKQNITNWTL